MSPHLTEAEQIRLGRSRFVSMAATYFLGAFNDNFFKQAAMLLAIAAHRSDLQGYATALFSLPFILFSSYAGYFADSYPKRSVVIVSKWIEVLAMIAGALGILWLNWPLIITMIFLMGLQSTLFGPALNGAIPELYPVAYVPRANALIKFASTAAILLGIGMAGVALDQTWFATAIPFGQILVAVLCLLIALVGVAVAYGCHRHPAAGKPTRFPWSGPWDSFRDVLFFGRDRELLRALLGSMFFYGMSTLVILLLNVLGLKQLGLTQTGTSLLVVCLMVGVCIGAFFGAKVTANRRWDAVLPLSAAGLGLGFAAVGFVGAWGGSSALALYLALVITGTFGGMFLIPVVSFIQVRPAANQKGRVIGASNFLDFSGIVVGGQLYVLLDSWWNPSTSLQVMGMLTVLVAVIFVQAVYGEHKPFSRVFLFCLRGFLSLRYRIHVQGLSDLSLDRSRGALFLPNHPALIDPVIMMSVLFPRFQVRPLVDETQVRSAVMRRILAGVEPILIPDVRQSGRSSKTVAEDALLSVKQALLAGRNVLLYPSGGIYRSCEECLWGNSSVASIVGALPETQIVLVHTRGLWGSSFSRASGVHPTIFEKFRLYLSVFLWNILFFAPRRRVDISFAMPADFPVTGDKGVINSYLEAHYNSEIRPNTFVPYFWWQGYSAEERLEPETDSHALDGVDAVALEIRAAVDAHLTEMSGISNLRPEMMLSRDLGIDSIATVDLMTWIEHRFGVPQENLEALLTVGSCYLAAVGQLSTTSEHTLKPVDPIWFAKDPHDLLSVPRGKNIGELFLAQACRHRRRAIVADQLGGVKTYGDLLVGILALQPRIASLPETHVGIMLPASVGAALIYLAVMFSGKVPVLVNWTAGKAHVSHGLDAVGVKTVITAGPLLERLQKQGNDLSGLGCTWLLVENMRREITLLNKIGAVVKARFARHALPTQNIAETAAVLFTSGSEAHPKAVPLTHENILTNVRDSVDALGFYADDRVLGMLPPFHSFGLTTNVVIPLCLGLRVAYSANPTDGGVLARTVENYRVSVVLGTPTFLGGILSRAAPGELRFIRLAVTGAEACPQHIFAAFAQACPHGVLCEGYGITECSPVVAVNRPKAAVAGTIGHFLGSLEWVVVDADSGERLSAGQRGRLLVRGPSVFSGYLNPEAPDPFVEFAGKPWYDTGDLVIVEADERIRFAGRLKRFVKIGGEMVSLPAIEAALQSRFPAGESGPTVAIDATSAERAEIVLFTTLDVTIEEVNQVVTTYGLSAIHSVRRIVRLDGIPLVGSGKVDYQGLKRLLVNG